MLWHLENRHTGATYFSKDEEKKALWDKAMEITPKKDLKSNIFWSMHPPIDFSL